MPSLSLSAKDYSLMAAQHVPDPSLWELIKQSPEKVTALVVAIGAAIVGVNSLVKSLLVERFKTRSDAKIATDKSEWDRMKDIVGILDQEVAVLRNRLDNVEKEHAERVATMQATIDSQAQQIVELTQDNQIKDLMLTGFEKSFEEFDKTRMDLNDKIFRLENEVARLKGA